MSEPERLHELNDKPENPRGKYVLYFMQQSMRTRFNHGLEYAVARANELGLPPVVCFGVTDAYPEANRRHYLFLLQGFRDVEKNLRARGIKFVVRRGPQQAAAIHFGHDAALVVCDFGYLRHQKAWVNEAADTLACRVVAVESDVVVPVEVVSNKHEIAARTIRPKLKRHVERFLVPVEPTPVQHPSLRMKLHGDTDVTDPAKLLDTFTNLEPVPTCEKYFEGGEDAARRMIDDFTNKRLSGYAEGRNEPASELHSYMSMYLHFGHVSPVDLALHIRDKKGAPASDKETYLEEAIVRRELSMNFCHFEPRYDQYACLPDWAKKTLAEQAADERPVVYTLEQLEEAETADPYWNAAQLQMTTTGFMHNYMRMYWGKKILEWTRSPQEAFERTLYLNNKYFLCGRDANSFTNVAWVFGLHDRPWGPRRKVFGTIRYMNAAGLKRKYDIDKYVTQIAVLAGGRAGHS